MARFIGSDSVLINVDFIVEVQKISEEMLKVTLKNGKIVHIPAFFFDDISGYSTIRQAIPVKDTFAVYQKNGTKEKVPVHMLAVTEMGFLRPIDLEDDYPEFMDCYNGYCGLIIDGKQFPNEKEAVR